jgi:hypothetical protein
MELGEKKLIRDLKQIVAIDSEMLKFVENGLKDFHIRQEEKFRRILEKSKSLNKLKVELEIERKKESFRLGEPKFFDLGFIKEYEKNAQDLSYIDKNYEYLLRKVKDIKKKFSEIEL